MTDKAPDKIAFYNICELTLGRDKGFAGYVDYDTSNLVTGQNFEKYIHDFRERPVKTPEKKPTRRKPVNSNMDPSLTIIAEAGCVKYVFVLDPDSRTKFDVKTPILPIPIPGHLSDQFIREVEVHFIDGEPVAASFVVDADSVKLSKLVAAINGQVHSSAVRLPFCLNLIDTKYNFPQWAIDDHRYEISSPEPHSHDPDHDGPKFAALKQFLTHGGAHPPGIVAFHNGSRTHGGVHPPGVASYVVVELP